ncbi:hypothetical protein AS034_05475 [[Bacillus] enclensis]|jgi:hypothetical protein|uniref:Uncharacterized protein n=1 Tax=[Bacillus] enclensis TaxID=1402860 RepID=A0A0V8HMA6_9BACI|nr:hypothetical protein [[Bacillus] enclensis]OAT84236.1 hypothetical protein A6P54_02795 [Bacillus sp. MKU004]QTC43502.1 hypothetical protein I7V34_09815 [Bacillus sp. V3]QWC21674.1 hypothetical protein KJK41_15280 [Bacillus haikouensis]KSU63695.1 hypothetical protein AS034_05475 [[Bacillus] enclensis]MBH9967448.1 hypothetical protein [[Bacillus] enclensis]
MNNKPNKKFHIQGIAWKEAGSYIPLEKMMDGFDGITVNLSEADENWGESLSFELVNVTKETKKLKIFFLVEWLSCCEETIGVLSLSKNAFYNYSKRDMAMSNVVTSADSIKKSVFPLNLKGLQMWKKSLKSGSLHYYPITNGLHMMAYMLEYTFKPFEVKQGRLFAVEGAVKGNGLILTDRMKNGLAFQQEK